MVTTITIKYSNSDRYAHSFVPLNSKSYSSWIILRLYSQYVRYVLCRYIESLVLMITKIHTGKLTLFSLLSCFHQFGMHFIDIVQTSTTQVGISPCTVVRIYIYIQYRQSKLQNKHQHRREPLKRLGKKKKPTQSISQSSLANKTSWEAIATSYRAWPLFATETRCSETDGESGKRERERMTKKGKRSILATPAISIQWSRWQL